MSCLRRVLFLIMTLFLNPSYTQNLVPNPSFENNTGCPGPIVFLTNTVDWFSIPDHSGTPYLFWKNCGYNGTEPRNTMASD